MNEKYFTHSVGKFWWRRGNEGLRNAELNLFSNKDAKRLLKLGDQDGLHGLLGFLFEYLGVLKAAADCQ
eukprot:3465489-Amphidinium_carterae.1